MSATAEEIQRVREWECGQNGHMFSEVVAFGSLDPLRIICTNCGAGWQVGKRDSVSVNYGPPPAVERAR